MGTARVAMTSSGTGVQTPWTSRGRPLWGVPEAPVSEGTAPLHRRVLNDGGPQTLGALHSNSGLGTQDSGYTLIVQCSAFQISGLARQHSDPGTCTTRSRLMAGREADGYSTFSFFPWEDERHKQYYGSIDGTLWVLSPLAVILLQVHLQQPCYDFCFL